MFEKYESHFYLFIICTNSDIPKRILVLQKCEIFVATQDTLDLKPSNTRRLKGTFFDLEQNDFDICEYIMDLTFANFFERQSYIHKEFLRWR